MIREQFASQRTLRQQTLSTDFLVVGGGLAGVCAAITAARKGVNVVLVQDRPVLGGNSSSEVRLWVLGATSHMGNNNRWAREGGVVDEILVENTYRNPEGNAVIFDTVLLEKVLLESNIQLLLNTAVYHTEKKTENKIEKVKAFCSQNSTEYLIEASFFCDASGDGIVAFQAGAPFRMGAESREEFGEKFAPDKSYGELLGHSIYFYSKDVGRPVSFVPPAYALQDITQIPRYKSFTPKEFGCRLWWIEYGGRLDTIHDTEAIKWELWKVVYGVWHYIKNSGNFPEAANLTLEWVGTIPGKRESRRFEGEYMLTQQDIVTQRDFPDAVAFGGWSMDLHPADGVFSERSGCNQWHPKGIFSIPFRCFYSRYIDNLLYAGRIISASHVAFGSTRVMGTSAHGAQAAGMAAALAIQHGWTVQQVGEEANMKMLQQELLLTGQHIPHLSYADDKNLVNRATLSGSSELLLHKMPPADEWITLNFSAAQMLPVRAGAIPKLTFCVAAEGDTSLSVELRKSSKAFNYTPEIVLGKKDFRLKAGEAEIEIDFSQSVDEKTYIFICFLKNESVSVKASNLLLSGLLTVYNKINKAVSNYGRQIPDGDIGVEEFEFWCPNRRPAVQNFAVQVSPALSPFGVPNINNGVFRPTAGSNCWIADLEDPAPRLTIAWTEPQEIKEIMLAFDTDYDHPMETSLMGHPESVMPFCVRNYRIEDEQQNLLCHVEDNYQTINRIKLPEAAQVTKLIIHLEHPSAHVPASVFGVIVR